MSGQEIEDLPLTEVWEMDKELLMRPPTDWLVAAYLGYKSPLASTTAASAGKANADAIAAFPKGLMPARAKPLSAAPEFLRTPAKLALIEKMKAEAHAR